jgi:nucleoside phosphorylase
LQPLYQALVHGCAAGRVQEALYVVYYGRILRGARAYSLKQLGAFGAEVGALANFFEHPWDRPAPELGPGDRAWLLSQAAYRLRGVGRLSEALEPMRAGLDMAVAQEDWTNAAAMANNLSELELTLGRIESAVADATRAVEYADRSEDAFWRLAMRTTLADARLSAGELAKARELFEQAEAMEAEYWPSMPELASLQGHRYCDLLLCPAERAAWRAAMQPEPPAPELSTPCRAVFERATRAMALATRQRDTLSIALDHLTLGRAALYATRLPAPTLTLADAREHLEAAVDTLRKAGAQDQLPKGLLTRAWLHHLEGHPELAHADLDEAMSIAERGPMPLIRADIHLHRARLFRDRTALTAAATLIHKHGYHRRLPELEAAQRDAAHWPAPTPRPNEIPPMTSTPPPWDPTLRPDLAILIALPEEFHSLAAEYAQSWHARPNPHHPGSDFLFVGPHGYRCIATIMPRMGPTVASQTSLRLLAWRPATIINVGIAGGFKDDLRIGDVIVPRQVDAYAETGKIAGMQWEPRGSSYRPSADLLATVQELEFTHHAAHQQWVDEGAAQLADLRADAAHIAALQTTKLLRIGPILSTNHLASGNFVVASKPFAQFIRAANADIHAGEMEAAGMMAAAEYWRESVKTLVVRGISDHVDADKKELDAIGDGALRGLAMANAWRLVTTLMCEQCLPRV